MLLKHKNHILLYCPRWAKFLCFFSIFFLSVVINNCFAEAKHKKNHKYQSTNSKSSNSDVAFDIHKYASLVIDYDTGRILHSKNASRSRRPASLTKMMTLYLAFEALSKGKLKMQQKLLISKKAASMPRTNMALKAGDVITVKEAILSLIVKSANDISVTIAEAIAGDEDAFVAIMNKKANKLGMKHTSFINPHGWHHERQMTTAYDMAILAVALQKHYPSYFPLFSKQSFVFKGKVIKGHNRILEKYWGANGLKTGYTAASGYNIVTSTSTPAGKLIAVVLGGKTAADRDAHTMALLDASYQKKISKKQRGNNVSAKVNYATTNYSSITDDAVIDVIDRDFNNRSEEIIQAELKIDKQKYFKKNMAIETKEVTNPFEVLSARDSQ